MYYDLIRIHYYVNGILDVMNYLEYKQAFLVEQYNGSNQICIVQPGNLTIHGRHAHSRVLYWPVNAKQIHRSPTNTNLYNSLAIRLRRRTLNA